MNYNLQGKTWEGASDLPQPGTAPSLTLVQKAGQRGRAHRAFGLASNNRNGFLTYKLKRELGTPRSYRPVRYDSRVRVQQTRCQRNSDYTRKSGAVRRESCVSLRPAFVGPLPIKASSKCVVNVLIGFLLVTHSFSLGNQPLCAQV